MFDNHQIVLIRGGGDLASGVALRLFRVGFRVVITEIDQPLVIRRSVSFAEAVFKKITKVENVTARIVTSIIEIESAWDGREIPVIVDSQCEIISTLENTGLFLSALVDGRMTKKPPYLKRGIVPFMIGLGPGFVVGENCDAIVETNRGHYLGRVIWEGSALPDTGVPEGFGDRYHDRVLRAPDEGLFNSEREIGDQLNPGDLIGEVNGQEIRANFKGVLRGLLHSGIYVPQGMKIGDLDPRNDPQYCRFVSDKAMAVAGGVLEAIMSRSNSS
ncbi:MAG: selenium-dependent molybdenum cofactor biosynthesis protein YqeB [Anaerolineales bacterium]|jgi:xanthine dehydrogenase accessory factor